MSQSDKPAGSSEKQESAVSILLKRALASRRAADRGAGEPHLNDIESPLSFRQERFWILDKLETNRYAANISQMLQFEGMINPETLEASLREIERRHEILRTTFPEIDGRPRARTGGAGELVLQIVDFKTDEMTARPLERADLRDIEQKMLETPFDLEKGPLWRATLLLTSEEESILLLVMHHIVGDGSSWPLLTDELARLYSAFSKGELSPLPDLTWQYRDYAVEQRRKVNSGELEHMVSYWQKQVEGIEDLKIPADHPRRLERDYAGGSITQPLSPGLQTKLEALSRRANVTLYMTMLAAFQLLLSRLSGQEDVAVGMPFANRNKVATENLIGCFINNVVLRTDLTGNPTFRDLLARVRKTTLEAFYNQAVPFEKLLETLQPERKLNQSPYFNVTINSLAVPATQFELPGFKMKVLPRERIVSQYDLTLYIGSYDVSSGTAPRTDLRLVYSKELFQAARMEEMLRQYVSLLEQIAADPDEAIGSYSLLTPQSSTVLPDPERILDSTWHGAIHNRVSHWANLQPEHPALVESDRVWSYQQLDRAVNSFASRLLTRGIEQGDVVAIHGGRSANLVVAILGVLKAGAAFLILNPDYPIERLLAMLRLADPQAIIDLAGDGGALLQQWRPAKFAMQLNSTEIDGTWQTPAKTTFPEWHADDLAFISFTSGSSGEPKGIRGRHGSLTHFLPWQMETLGLGSGDRFSMLSAVNYDGLQREVFTSLWVGAALHIPADDVITSPGRLARWMHDNAISFVHMTPPITQTLLPATEDTVPLTGLRTLFSLGDSLTVSTVEQVRRLAPNVTYINSFGTTETQRAVSCNMIPAEMSLANLQPNLPAGEGMPGAQLLIANRSGNQAGIGEVGEIWVRSPHLALGYHLDEALTKERFIPNPLSSLEEDLVYRTGDSGRYLPDGSVAHLGRRDGQVKIRGHRVELSEIDAQLARHPDVQQAATVAYKDDSGDFLAAYVVPAGQVNASTLRQYLSVHLPEVMVPGQYVQIEALPLTVNGKVDRDDLAKRTLMPIEPQTAYVAPRTPNEETLAAIWANVLNLPHVGIHDNFFDLGGHSLIAMQVFRRIRHELHVELPVRAIFEGPTVAEMAEVVFNAQLDGLDDDDLERLLAGLE